MSERRLDRQDLNRTISSHKAIKSVKTQDDEPSNGDGGRYKTEQMRVSRLDLQGSII
jgi:hypothetical protein